MKRILLTLLLLFGLITIAQASYLVVMKSSNGIKDVPAAAFSFRINGGKWRQVSAGKTVYQRSSKPINNVEVKFGFTPANNAIFPSCHKIIPVGQPDSATSAGPGRGDTYPVYTSWGPIQANLSNVKDHKVVTFTLIGLGNSYCNGSASDCVLYDCWSA